MYKGLLFEDNSNGLYRKLALVTGEHEMSIGQCNSSRCDCLHVLSVYHTCNCHLKSGDTIHTLKTVCLLISAEWSRQYYIV